jgi:hypothetical protein
MKNPRGETKMKALMSVIAVALFTSCAANTHTQSRKTLDALILCDAFVQSIATSATALTSYTSARYLSVKVHPDESNLVWCNNEATGGAPAVDSNAFEVTGGAGFGVTDDTADIQCIAETGATQIMAMVFKEKC